MAILNLETCGLLMLMSPVLPCNVQSVLTVLRRELCGRYDWLSLLLAGPSTARHPVYGLSMRLLLVLTSLSTTLFLAALLLTLVRHTHNQQALSLCPHRTPSTLTCLYILLLCCVGVA